MRHISDTLLDSAVTQKWGVAMKQTILALAIVALTFEQASAVFVLSDNFDSYANQAAFEAAWPAIGTTAPLSGVLSTTQASSSPNSIYNPGTTTGSQSRNRRAFSETSTLSTSGNLGIGDQLIFSFDMYDSAPAASPARNYVNLQDSTAPSATNQLVAMGFNNNQTGGNSGGQYYMGRILGFSPPTVDPDGGPNEAGTLGSGAFFKLNDFGVGLRSLGWHNLKVILSTDDGLSTDYSFYVDNALAERVSNVGTTASIRSYDNIALGSGLSNASTDVYWDNVQLEYIPAAVPEANAFAAIAMVGLVSLGAVWIRKWKAQPAREN